MGEGALLAKHCFASARTHSRQRLGRTPEGGLRRVLHTHTAPPLPGMPAFEVDVASAGAGRSPAKALYRKITVASVPCPGSLARLTFQPKRSHNRRTIDRPSPVPCGRLGSAR
ncbi:hypothetical protein N440_0257 [Stenotrophomonas sp. CC22-02]|nr:hypothetical protein N440_0257 [Stenotrophomonas sp. CC22-02]